MSRAKGSILLVSLAFVLGSACSGPQRESRISPAAAAPPAGVYHVQGGYVDANGVIS